MSMKREVSQNKLYNIPFMTKQSRLLRTNTRPQFFPLLLPSTERLVSMKILKTLSINLTPYPSILPSNFDMKPY